MANPRKFSEKIALLNQKQAEETAAFEAIMREVSDVTSRVASASSSVGASPTGTSGVQETPLIVQSAGASPSQSSGNKHLHINLGNQFRAGGSLPNVNNNVTTRQATKDSSPNSTAICPIDFKTALSNLEEIQNNQFIYRNEKSKNPGVGPMRSRPMERRYDTSPYSGTYLSPPLPDTWRRANSDSALHQSANEACQSTSTISHRRDHHGISNAGDNRDGHHVFLERPRSSCEMQRVPGIHIHPSSQPPGPQTPIGNNTGSLPDLSNVHYSSPLPVPLDHEDHSSSTQYTNSPQTGSPTTLSLISLAQAGRLSIPQEHSPSETQGVTLENSTNISQKDLQPYAQQTSQQSSSTTHSPGHHYIYRQPHSPVPSSHSPEALHLQLLQKKQPKSLGSYRTSQLINRPSPQSSPNIAFQGSPLSYSNNPSAPPSPTNHLGSTNLTHDNIDQNSYFINQAQAAALQQTFEQFNMGAEVDWVQVVQQLVESGWTTQMDSVDPNTIGSFIASSNNTSDYSTNDMINVGGEFGSSETNYYSTSPQMAYQPRTPTTTQQLTPQTPNTPTIILTDFSGTDDLTSTEYTKDLGSTISSDFDPDLFTSDDALRQGLGPIDLDGLQMLTDPDMVISDANAEDHFRLDRL
ncbi:CREB-regulated transcription coactivator 1-like isoform X2 [Chelonus insularis]|uniref:CREB-regulated transcription coactivator 1-like isoform X2 n=1 Tax=Chelonus insularis TaxID=460826 RepID=UPI00158A8A79|nr:CREB-regulated transcription coactivator 1-like isoform X2 [Chelonus insularis]